MEFNQKPEIQILWNYLIRKIFGENLSAIITTESIDIFII
jgi:hypothetical protein